jgi:hypothetical protein
VSTQHTLGILGHEEGYHGGTLDQEFPLLKFGLTAPFVPPTSKRAHRTLLRINHQKDECPEKVLDLSFLGNEIVFIEKVPHDKYDGCADPKVLFEEPVLHNFCSDATAAPVLYVPCELVTIVISSSTRDTDPGRYQYHCRPW